MEDCRKDPRNLRTFFLYRYLLLDKYFVRIETLDRIRSAWIGEAVERYVSWLSEQRYSFRTVYRRVPIAVSFGRFARERGVNRWEDLPAHVEAFVESWLKTRTPKRKSRLKEMSDMALNAVEQMLRVIVPGFVSPRISVSVP